MKSKYFLETVNANSQYRGRTSPGNRLPIKNITERQDGTLNIHVAYQGHDKRVPVDLRRGQRPKNMLFRDQAGTLVDPNVVIEAFGKKI